MILLLHVYCITFSPLQMAGRGKLVPCMCLGLFAALCWVWVSFASFTDDQLPLEVLDAVDQGAFQPQSALSDMEFASISSYRGPGNSDSRSNKELPILLWWSGGLFPHFPGDTERIDCATSSCLATSNRKVPDTFNMLNSKFDEVLLLITLSLIFIGAALQTDIINHLLWNRLQGI